MGANAFTSFVRGYQATKQHLKSMHCRNLPFTYMVNRRGDHGLFSHKTLSKYVHYLAHRTLLNRLGFATCCGNYSQPNTNHTSSVHLMMTCGLHLQYRHDSTVRAVATVPSRVGLALGL